MYKLIKVGIVILLASAAVRAQTPECNVTADWEYNSLGNQMGTYRVWLANNNTPNCAANPLSQVSKPIIIAGGWDPTNDWDELDIYIYCIKKCFNSSTLWVENNSVCAANSKDIACSLW